MSDSPRYRFPKSSRLGGRGTFQAIKDSGMRHARGPLTLWTTPNALGLRRLGIGIGRHCGNAVRRNLIKRRIREAFRLLQHEFPGGVDVVISVRPHEPLALHDYQAILLAVMQRVKSVWQNPPQ